MQLSRVSYSYAVETAPLPMLAHIVSADKSEVRPVSNNAVEYQGARFGVLSTRLNVQPPIMPRISQLVVCIGAGAYGNAQTVLSQLSTRLPFFGLQSVEIGQYYTDLQSGSFKYVQQKQGAFQNVETAFCTPESFQTQQKAMENRMTTQRRKPSPKTSYLFVVRPRCSAECQDTHGEIRILVIGEDREKDTQAVLDVVGKNASYTPGMLNDVVYPCIGRRVEIVAGIVPGNEATMMGYLLSCGALK